MMMMTMMVVSDANMNLRNGVKHFIMRLIEE